MNQYLAISDFVIGESESIHSIKQTAFHHLRSENEKKHISKALNDVEDKILELKLIIERSNKLSEIK